MKSQISTPVLCLLLALFLGIGPVFSAMKSVDIKTKATDNKVFTSAVSNVVSFNDTDLKDTKGSAKKTLQAASLNILDNKVAKAPKSEIEEISYKNIVLDTAESEISSTNQKIAFANNQSLFKNGMFYGFTLMVVLLNLVCFFLFEEKIFLYYSFALTGVTVSFMYSDSLLALIGLNGIENIAAMQSTLLLAATSFGALFATKYLTLQEFFPKLKWFTMGLLCFAFMMVFSGWISDTNMFTGIANTAMLTVMTLYYAAGVALFSRKNYAKFYVIAYSIPLLFAIDFFVLKKFGIEFLFTQSFHLKAATIVEMLIVTYAIMYRMRAIKEEHVMRQTEMRIFLKRQEVINRSNTQKLMQDIYLENLIMQYDLDGLEIKLLQYISEGKDNAKIARKLKTNEAEIEMLTKELYDKLAIGEQIQEDYRIVDTQPAYIYN